MQPAAKEALIQSRTANKLYQVWAWRLKDMCPDIFAQKLKSAFFSPLKQSVDSFLVSTWEFWMAHI